MNNMKVLWLSNKRVTDTNIKGSGSWLISMANSISKEVELYNITQERNITDISQYQKDGINEFVLPVYKKYKGKPSNSNIQSIISLIQKINPDIIHVWGTENYWGLLPLETFKAKLLLDIQGVLYACYDFYLGGLHFEDFIKYQDPIRAIYSFLFLKIQKFRMGGRIKYEKHIIDKFNNISYQSEWVLHKIKAISSNKHFYPTSISVRNEFVENASKWVYGDYNRIVTVVSPQSYKGIHTTIKAFSIIKKNRPDLRLSIIGNIKSKTGYTIFLRALIKKLGLTNSIDYLGALNATEMVRVFLSSNCLINSSYVESYSLVMAESMMIGLPSVVAYSGAMVELGENNESVLYYTPGDYVECASNAMRIIQDREVAFKLSLNSSKIAINRNNGQTVSLHQMNIYKSILR